ncbi:MAG: SMP-30/gluconolactonase/LRE family protein [Sphingobium sp.]|uniref:SMP-30/gluconolactonase/LRE family protein n=1 Tax=Sphingobium sp. TaxID=1912891 RepID=UPI0029A7C5D8|nr:SMP-30/gluconolactonase/LRE family protein [Sphingobium sp.]MDX3908407.1 SMP-30/gluconolactonase/LRE family protein [Sphingobium sp.]
MIIYKTQYAYRSRLRTRLLATALAAVFAGPGVTAQTATPAIAARSEGTAPALDRAQLDALLTAPDKVLFIDVRRAEEISAIGSFPVFLNIQASELDRFLPFIPKDRQIVTLSNHAGRAKKAAAYLTAHGFTVAGAAGVQDYAKQGGFLYGQKIVTPAITGVVAADTRVEVIREGFEGTEGPVALKDGAILFTENRADRIVKIAPDNSISTYLEKTGGANALAVDAKGALLAVQTAPPGIAVLQPKPKLLASAYAGKLLNRPNDLAVSKGGNIYFSDPGAAPQAGVTPPKAALYWLDPKGKVTLIADDIRRPNGVALSPDEKTLYVANTAGEALIAFTIRANGSVAERRDFVKLAGFKDTPNGPSSGADGIVVDAEGRVYVASSAGIQIFSPAGEALGIIALPKAPQNLAFGGPDHAHLYAVGRGSVYRIATLTHGVARPGK